MRSHVSKVQVYVDKSKYKQRWILLSVSVWINTAAYYCFDQPTALHNTLRRTFADSINPDIFEIYFGGLYSVYAFANIFLPFISGKMRDTMGDRIVLIFLTFIMIMGQAIFCQGTIMKNFWIMYAGRILVGWGIESCLATQNSLLQPYFKYDYLSTVVSLNQFFALLGTIICMWYLPMWAEMYGLNFAIMTGVFVNMVALACSILTFIMDRNAEHHQSMIISRSGLYVALEPAEEESFWAIFNKKSVSALGRLYWIMAFIMAIFYTIIICSSNVSVGLISERWLIDDPEAEIKAGRMNGAAWATAAISTPIFGSIIDLIGCRALLTILTSLITISSQVLLWYYSPLGGLILMGLGFGLSYATIWSGVLKIVRENHYGKAFAYIISLQQIGLVVGPMVVGILRSQFGTYYYSTVLLIILGGISFILSLVLYLEDKYQKSFLDKGFQKDNGQNNTQDDGDDCNTNEDEENEGENAEPVGIIDDTKTEMADEQQRRLKNEET